MGQVKLTVRIDASPERVYDLITDVEGFVKYSKLIKSIERTAENRYRWRVEIMGIPIEWESEVSCAERARRMSWVPISGAYNAGSYELEADNSTTVVHFEMEYRFAIKLIEELTAPVVSRVIESIHKEVLGNVKKALEGQGAKG